MSTQIITREKCEEAWRAYEENGGNASAAARSLGIARTTLRERLARGEKLYGLGGNTSVKAPKGQRIVGTSTLQDARTGETVLQWVKTKAEEEQRAQLRETLVEIFSEYKGKSQLPKPPPTKNRDLHTVYPIADQHLGLYAWAKETGEDYDLDIACSLLRESMADLVSRAPESDTATILNLGDFFHTDNESNRTNASGHALDVDTRWAKVLKAGVQVQIDCIEMALEKHRKVVVRNLPGNHDEHSAQMLTIALALFFANNKRLSVDEDPSLFYAERFGANMIAAHHGHKVRLGSFAGRMAALWPQMWGETKFRFGYQGHLHHGKETKCEHDGAVCRIMNTLAAKDSWGAGMGFTSIRMLEAITFHVDRGYYGSEVVSV